MIYEAPVAGGGADPVGFNNTMQSFLAANQVTLGVGVLNGLTTDGSGNLSAGRAFVGIVASYAGGNIASQLGYAATNYVYLQLQPVAIGAYPNSQGIDTGVIVVNQTGSVTIPNSVLLCTLTTVAGAITAHNNNPTDLVPITRNNLQVPFLSNELAWQGAWSSSTAYGIGNGVFYNGSGFICLVANTNEQPSGATPPISTTYWSVLVEQGATGATYTPPTLCKEAPSGLVNGTNVTYTLTHSPNTNEELILTLGGLVQREGTGLDFTVSGNTITAVNPWASGVLWCIYRY